MGDHQVGCGGNGDRIHRHYSIRDALFSAAHSLTFLASIGRYLAIAIYSLTFLASTGRYLALVSTISDLSISSSSYDLSKKALEDVQFSKVKEEWIKRLKMSTSQK